MYKLNLQVYFKLFFIGDGRSRIPSGHEVSSSRVGSRIIVEIMMYRSQKTQTSV